MIETRMDLPFLTPPAWAPTWCYVYFLSSMLVVAGVVVLFITGFKKMSAFELIVLLLAGAVNFLHSITYFWICRKSLA